MVYEKKTVVSNEKLDDVLTFFDAKASKADVEKQVIYNYHTEKDLRLIRTKKYAKLSLKTNNDSNEVYITKQYEKDLIELFFKIGLNVDFKRFRIRNKYICDNLYITIDKNIKTGNIFRIKASYETEQELEQLREEVKNLFLELNIEETTLDHFQKIYGKYRTDWADLTKDIDEEEFLK